jgi:hypothetical protein
MSLNSFQSVLALVRSLLTCGLSPLGSVLFRFSLSVGRFPYAFCCFRWVSFCSFGFSCFACRSSFFGGSVFAGCFSFVAVAGAGLVCLGLHCCFLVLSGFPCCVCWLCWCLLCRRRLTSCPLSFFPCLSVCQSSAVGWLIGLVGLVAFAGLVQH